MNFISSGQQVMPSCKRVAMLWLLSVVLYGLLMPGTSMLTYNSKCRYVRNKEVISVKGGYSCKQTKVKLGMCVGTCSSYAFPIPIDSDMDEAKFQTECQCCAPKETKQKTVRFGEGCEKTIVVQQIRSCECKNCSRRNL